jgi:hypothetical protein
MWFFQRASIKVFFASIAGILLATAAIADPHNIVKNKTIREENPKGWKSALVLPYAFSTDSMGFTYGVGGMLKGYGQEQLLLGATAFSSSDDAVGLFLGMWDYRPPWTERFFFGAQGMVGHYPKNRAYAAPYYRTGTDRPGSNDSDKDDYAEESGYDNWTDFKLEYVLSIGAARHDALFSYQLKGGMLQSDPVGGSVWNPFKSGVTTLLIRQYNRYESFETDLGDIDATTHPVQLAITYNNTDFPPNPSYGSNLYVGVTHDFGWWESPDSWTFAEMEFSKYFSLGESDWAKQRVIALDFWTGDSPTWEEDTVANSIYEISHRPPFYEGATLGGFYRMRGYPIDRFNDQAVIYTAAEYRYTLKWNPLGQISWLKFLQSDWLQLVGFLEGGRVADAYQLSELLSDWKVDGGFGLRAMFAGAVVRLDAGFSDEGAAVWAMFGHPF